jgi:hypothetical protein
MVYEEQRQIDQIRRWYSGLAMILAQIEPCLVEGALDGGCPIFLWRSS